MMSQQESCQPPRARNILELPKEEKQKFLDSFDFVLLDCDGVIWMLMAPIPNTGPAIMQLKHAGKKCKFISNNSMRTDEEYLEKLASIGVPEVTTSDIVHPAKTITRYLQRFMPGEPVFSICSEEMNETLRQNGIKVQTMQSQEHLSNSELLARIKPTDKVAAVIADLNFHLTYSELSRAQQYLLQDDCRLLVGASDTLVPISDDFITLGSASFVNALQQSTGKQPIVLGKPGALLGVLLLEKFQISQPGRVLFIGDNLKMDIGFAKGIGFQSLLVLSGATTHSQLLQLPEEDRPDFTAHGLADFNEFFKEFS